MLRLRAAIRRPAPYLVIPVLLTAVRRHPGLGRSRPRHPPLPPRLPRRHRHRRRRADPVVAKVNGQPIYLSDLQAAAQGLPDNLRGMPPQMLFPMLLDQLIDGRALVIEAKKTGLDKDPLVARADAGRRGPRIAECDAQQGSRPASDRRGGEGALRQGSRRASRPRRKCTPATSWWPTRPTRRRSSPS